MNILDAKNLFGLGENFTIDELKKAYRSKCKQYHPDVNQGKNTEEDMKKINSAFEILKKYVSEKKQSYNFSNYKKEKTAEIMERIKKIKILDLNNYGRKMSEIYLRFLNCERQIYSDYVKRLNECKSRQELDRLIRNFDYKLENLINEFIDKLFEKWEFNIVTSIYYDELLDLYKKLKKENIKCLTINSAFLKFKDMTNQILLEEQRLNKVITEEVEKIIDNKVTKYISHPYYSILENKINLLKKKYVDFCIYNRNKINISDNIKSMTLELDSLFDSYSKFVVYKQEKIKYISGFIKECPLSEKQRVDSIINKYVTELSLIEDKNEFDLRYNVIEKNLNELSNKLHSTLLQEKKLREISNIKDILLSRFSSADNSNIKVSRLNSYTLFVALEYLSSLINNNVDRVKLYYLSKISFIDLENDKRIVDFIQDKVDYIPMPTSVMPNITKEKLLVLYNKIKPIIDIENRKFIIKNFVIDELENKSYIQDIDADNLEEIDLDNYDFVTDFECFHTLGVTGYFNPTVKEVLSQIPVNLIHDANAFEIVSIPQIVKNINMRKINPSYFRSKVRLYTKKK